MITNTTPALVWMIGWVVVLHSIGPLSLAYCILARTVPSFPRPPWLFQHWMVAETTFYIATHLYQRYYLQRPAKHPPLLSKSDRRRLYKRCHNNAQDLHSHISKWFLNKQVETIKKENIKEWIRWAFFNTDVEDSAYDEEIEDYLKDLETRLGIKFKPGRADLKCIRLTLDEVKALHRSLLWYTCILVVDILTHGWMYYHKFRFYRASLAQSASVLPPRPQVFFVSRLSPSRNLAYWYQPHTSDNELPILFLHGMGVGLYPYINFLRDINRNRRAEDGKIGILAVELLYISSRITVSALGRDAMCEELRKVLCYHGFSKFALISHSYGSAVTAYLLTKPDLASQISSVILIDPISILLHQPDVVHNFTIRKPKLASEWLLWYFGSKDMGIAHTLGRNFFWSEHILWKEDFSGRPTTVFLAEKDSIINAAQVRTYLQQEQEMPAESCLDGNGEGVDKASAKGREEMAPWTVPRSELNVVWCPDLDHGHVFDLPLWRARLKLEVLDAVRLPPVS